MAQDLGACLICIKYSLFIFNFLFWILGCSLIGVGLWVAVDARKLLFIYNANVPEDIKQTVGVLDEDVVQAAGVAILVIGAVIMISGFLGCCGSIRESQALLAMFFAILLLMFAALIAIAVVAIVKAEWLKDLLAKTMRLESSGEGRRGNTLLAYSYRTYGCCGVNDLPKCDRDYPPFDVSPKPCAIGTTMCNKGCLNVIWGAMSQLALGAGAAALVASVFVILGMIFSMCLCSALKEKYY